MKNIQHEIRTVMNSLAILRDELNQQIEKLSHTVQRLEDDKTVQHANTNVAAESISIEKLSRNQIATVAAIRRWNPGIKPAEIARKSKGKLPVQAVKSYLQGKGL
jgi:hypothetical protein